MDDTSFDAVTALVSLIVPNPGSNILNIPSSSSWNGT